MAVPLTRVQVGILLDLSQFGPQRASMFNEMELDELFKMRPRLIRLVPGFEDAVIDITAEGQKRLATE